MRRDIISGISFVSVMLGAYLVVRVQEFRNAGAVIKPGTMLHTYEQAGIALVVVGFICAIECLVSYFLEDLRRARG